MKIKIFLIIVYLLFTNIAIAKISINSQKSLINTNVISENISCSKLSELIGGLNQTDLLWLDNKNGENFQFALINTRTKENDKIYYVCGNVNNLLTTSDITYEVLNERSLLKIFYNSSDLFTYIFSITGPKGTQYILSRLIPEDFNMTRDDLMASFRNSLKLAVDEDKPKKEPKKTEPKKTVKKNKQTKIAKDQNPPVIKIADTFNFNDTTNQITGEVSDKDSKKTYVTYKDDWGQESGVDVIDGKFTFTRYSPISEELLIIATDTSGNEVREKIKINIIKKTVSTKVIDRLDPTNIKSKNRSNRVALIIGIEKYSNAPKASYANKDAEHFYEYAKIGFGISEDNIKLLIDENATAGNYYDALEIWLPARVKPNITELIVFFSGHGLSDGKELYLLAHDSKTAFKLLPRTALLKSELFDEINKLKPKSVTIFFDTCYSGTSRDNIALLPDAKPLLLLAPDTAKVPKNFVVFSSSLGTQISSSFKQAKNGLFSYYLMKGLEGKADSNNDRRITNGELEEYLNSNISKKASEIGREQNSQLVGNPNDNYAKKILMVYK